MPETPAHSPLVTVIIPTFNLSAALQLTLQTVLMQDLEDFETWVIGDGCTDDSEGVVASFGDSRLRWINLPTNSGSPSMPRNEGLRRARGRFVAYLGHDDLWFPWHLSGLVDRALRDDLDFVYSLGLLIKPQGVSGAFSLRQQSQSHRTALSPSNWLHSRRLVDIVGPWSQKLKTADDHELVRRVLQANTPTGFHPELSVLKFPAVAWRMYSLTPSYPQAPYVAAMHTDPQRLRLRLLTELGTAVARQGWDTAAPTSPLLASMQTLAWRARRWYGVHRWPVNHFHYRRWRRRVGLTSQQSRQ